MPPRHLSCLFCLTLAIITADFAHVAEWSALDAYLERCETDYSAQHEMLGASFNSPGYHSQVPQGTWVHPTRQSLNYAVMLVRRGHPEDLKRAEQVIRKVLSLQVTDPKHEYYGIWPWLLEEPVDEMAPPDRNWADFLGAQLAVLLKQYADRLPEELTDEIRASLRHAAIEIRKRDVQPSYTNIAIMGGGVCAAAGELLDDAEMLAYGRDRLQRCVADAEYHGSFNEYNSPTYTKVALNEAERALQLIEDREARAAAEKLRRIAWQIIADSFHPGTGQWAGPHSRAYDDFLSDATAEYLMQQTGAKITGYRPDASRPAKPEAIEHLPCPDGLRERFRRLPKDPVEIRRTFNRKEKDEDSIVGTTWFTADACLGSVNRSMLWTQRRTLIGYWTIQQDEVAVLRQQFLHDGKEFASMGVRNAQRGPRVLSLFEPLRNKGSWHPTLDRPADGIFTAEDFRVRYELRGEGAAAEQVDANRFELTAGDRRVVVHTLPGRFAGCDVRWVCDTQGDVAVVDGICYQGDPRQFDFGTLDDVALVAAIELLDAGQSGVEPPVLMEAPATPPAAAWAVGAKTLCVSR